MEHTQHRLFRFPISFSNSATSRKLCVYLAGALWAIGIWLFLDCALYSRNANGSDLHVTFIDWLPILCSMLGMLTVTSLDKDQLLKDSLTSGTLMRSNNRAWQGQAVLFLGFALQAGGLAGSFAVLVLKFIVGKHATYPTLAMGVNNVLGNIAIAASCTLLWIAHNIEDVYSYSLTL